MQLLSLRAMAQTATRHAPHGDHSHHLHESAGGWRYGLAIGLNIAIVAVQLGVGLAIGSTALMADAGHNASDVLGLLLAGWAAWLMTRPGSARRTYGYGKAGVLAALANSLLLVFASGALAYQAVGRLLDPPDLAPAGLPMLIVAGIAVAVNLASGWLLMGGAAHDVNRRAAVVHLFADAGVSLGVMAAGAIILWTGARWVDPVASLLVVVVILAATWRLLRQSLDMALDAAPAGLDVEAVETWLRALPGVTQVHDLHVWPISASVTALTAHLVVPGESDDTLLRAVHAGLKAQFGIGHSTVQVERGTAAECDGLHG